MSGISSHVGKPTSLGGRGDRANICINKYNNVYPKRSRKTRIMAAAVDYFFYFIFFLLLFSMPVNWSVFSFDERQRDGIFLTARRGEKNGQRQTISPILMDAMEIIVNGQLVIYMGLN